MSVNVNMMGSNLHDGHNNLARMVFASSPVLLKGSTLKLAPSISPTPRSVLTPLSGDAFCVLPVIRSVFSGTESFGVKSGSTEVSISGGGLSLPRDGNSLEIVELVLVM